MRIDAPSEPRRYARMSQRVASRLTMLRRALATSPISCIRLDYHDGEMTAFVEDADGIHYLREYQGDWYELEGVA